MHTQNYYWILNVKSISVDNTSSDYVARLGGVNMPVGLLGCALLFSIIHFHTMSWHRITERKSLASCALNS